MADDDATMFQRQSASDLLWGMSHRKAFAHAVAQVRLARQTDLRNCVGKGLAMGHSPEQIAGRLALEHGRVIISHESIYRFIYHRTAQKDYWHRLLPRHKLRRGRRGRPGGSPASFLKQRRSISERPAEVEDRGRRGRG